MRRDAAAVALSLALSAVCMQSRPMYPLLLAVEASGQVRSRTGLCTLVAPVQYLGRAD